MGVREWGISFIPEREILDKFKYKALFYQQLSKVVNQRIDTLNQKYFDVSDYTLKGAVDFLAKMARKGATVSAEEMFYDYPLGYGDNQLFANQVFDWLARASAWLAVTPQTICSTRGFASTCSPFGQ